MSPTVSSPPFHQAGPARLSGPHPARDPALHLGALLAIAIAFGGGGVGAGIGNMAVQLAAVLVMALHPRAFALFFQRRPVVLTLLVALSVLLPLVQLIPLPPALWAGLPGRDMVAASLDLTGGTGWFPLSLDPARTLTAFLGTLVPMTVIVVGSVLPPERLRWLMRAVVVMGILAMLYGALQLAGPRTTGFGSARMGATFADWNGAAVFFSGCLLLAIALFPDASAQTRPDKAVLGKLLLAGAGLLLLTGVVLTQSRTGIALLVVPVAFVILRAIHALLPRRAGGERKGSSRPVITLVAIGVAGVLLAGTLSLSSSGGRLAEVFSRFEAGDDGKRAEMREDALSAAHHYWPVGAGMGTFDEVFQVDESLEYLSARRAGRAHMDYYELAIEAGPVGLALAAAWLAWVLVAAWKALRGANWPALAGAGFLVCCAGQSLLSFPLRNQTMLALAGLAVVLLRTAMRPVEVRS